MGIINKYIFREIFSTWLIVMLTLFIILMSSQFSEILNQAATGRIPKSLILNTLILTSIQYINILIPFGLFLAIMLSLAKLNRNSEMTVLNACAIGPPSILKPIIYLAMVLSFFVAWLSLYASPNALNIINNIKLEAENEIRIGIPEEGKFIPFNNNKAILYIEEIKDMEFNNVFIQQDYDDNQAIIIAEKGRKISSTNNNEIIFVLENGKRYDGEIGSKKFQITEFSSHNIPILSNIEMSKTVLSQNMTSSELLNSNNINDIAELHWILASPISVLILSFLASTLISISPRQSNYAQLGIGILIYMIYINFLTLGKVWMEREILPSWIGLWPVHLTLATLSLILFYNKSGLNINKIIKNETYR